MEVNAGRIEFGLRQTDQARCDTPEMSAGDTYAGAITAERLIETAMSFVLALHVNLVVIQYLTLRFAWGHVLPLVAAGFTILVLGMAVVEKLSFERNAGTQPPEGSMIDRIVANAAFLALLPMFLPSLTIAHLWCNRR